MLSYVMHDYTVLIVKMLGLPVRWSPILRVESNDLRTLRAFSEE